MPAKRLRSAIFDQRGVTLVELIVVFAILGLLASIALGEFYYRRQKAYDNQAIAVTKHLLTLAATAFASDEIPTVDGTSDGAPPEGYPELSINPGISTRIDMAADGSALPGSDGAGEVWSFYVGSMGGNTAYFFWLPGPDCTASKVRGVPSDMIIDNDDYGAENWRSLAFLDLP